MTRAVRKVSTIAGRFIDHDDQRAIGFLLTWSAALGLTATFAGGGVGLGVYLFEVLTR